jgi:hypothetical protein
MKYNIAIPKPAKSMNDVKILIHRWDGGWSVASLTVHQMSPDTTLFEFEIPDNVEWKRNKKVVNGPDFWVEVHYANRSGTKLDIKELVPQKM